MAIKKRRDVEITSIRKANRACAVGNLMLGKIKDWQEFLKPETEDLSLQPRKNLRSGSRDIKKNLSKEIKAFCSRNFENMENNSLDRLYDAIKASRGLSVPLSEFEKNFARFKRKALRGIPLHATVEISLWGLQFKFPEDFLSKDICEAIQIVKENETNLGKYQGAQFSQIKISREEIGLSLRRQEYAIRTSLLCCFNLLESFLNGLAWEFVQDPKNLMRLTSTEKKLIGDSNQASLRDKLFKYPKIISQRELEDLNKGKISDWIKYFKPFRDSLVHPSPFNVPEKFGGYDKLQKLYSVDPLLALEAARVTYEMCKVIYCHIYGTKSILPDWLNDFRKNIDAN